MTRDTKTIRQPGYTRRSVLQTVVAAVLIPFVRVSATTRGGVMEIKRSGSQPSAKGVSGRYWHHRRPQPPAKEVEDPVFQDQLSARLAEMTGVSLF